MRAVGLWALCACTLASCSLGVSLPEGRIACSVDADCPQGWVCRVPDPASTGLCFRATASQDLDASTTADGGADIDGASADAGATTQDDAGEYGSDAGQAEDSATESDDGQSALPDAADVPDANRDKLPVINAVSAGKRRFTVGATSVSCLASDSDGDALSYAWSANNGSFTPADARATRYTAETAGEVALMCTVDDGHGGIVSDSVSVRVYPPDWLLMLPFSLDSADQSGNGNDARVEGGVYGPDRAAHINSAMVLDGSAGRIEVANQANFKLSAWSFVVTLKPAANHAGTIVAKADTGFGNLTIFMYASNDANYPGRIQYLQTGAGNTPYAVMLGTYSAAADTFFQLALTMTDTGEFRAYVDGRLIQSQSAVPAATQNDAPLVLGSGVLGSFAGTIDEVQMYKRALTAEEISALAGMQ